MYEIGLKVKIDKDTSEPYIDIISSKREESTLKSDAINSFINKAINEGVKLKFVASSDIHNHYKIVTGD